jgi:hypothetical protein
MVRCPRCGFKYDLFDRTVKRPRTTGKGSQSNHLHGHLQQIAEFTGYGMSEVKDVLKADLADWPHVERFGRMVPVSEAELDTLVEAAAIEWTHAKAEELGVVLREA